jgi:hypothetical protein
MKRKSEKPRVIITRDDLALGTEKIEPDQRFDILVAETQKSCKTVGLRKGLIADIFETDSDWVLSFKRMRCLKPRARKFSGTV